MSQWLNGESLSFMESAIQPKLEAERTMKKLLVRLMIALVTFLVGVSSSQLWSLRQTKIRQIKPGVIHRSSVSPTTEAWRRIVVKDRFSFYIPPYLKDDGGSVSSEMATGAFRKENYDMSGLFFLYYYSDKVPERDPTKEAPRYRFTMRSEGMLGGKRAIMVTEIPATNEIWCIHDGPGVQVYFPDIGGGEKLYMRFASGDVEGIEVARQILASIKFPERSRF
jgi:hypothetical protein